MMREKGSKIYSVAFFHDLHIEFIHQKLFDYINKTESAYFASFMQSQKLHSVSGAYENWRIMSSNWMLTH